MRRRLCSHRKISSPPAPPPPRKSAVPSPAIARADKRNRSRDAFASEFLFKLQEECLKRTGGISFASPTREAERRTTRPRYPYLHKTRARSLTDRSPFGAPPRLYAGTFQPQLGLGRASWNRRMQTGGPSPTPVQQAPCSPITRRTGRCPDRLRNKVTSSIRKNRSRSVGLVTGQCPSRRAG